MPIHDNSSYIRTLNEFLSHWAEVNVALPSAKPMVLKTGLTRAGLVTLRDGLQTQLDLVQEELNDHEMAAEGLKQKRQVMLARINEFNGVVDAITRGRRCRRRGRWPRASGRGRRSSRSRCGT